MSYERQGLGDVHRPLRRQPGQHADHHPQRRQRQPGERRRNLAAPLQPEGPAVSGALPGDRELSDRAFSASRANNLNAFAPDIKIASARSWTVGFQRSISRDMAVDIRYVGTRGVDQWSDAQLQRPRHRGQRLHQRVQARRRQPPGQQRRRRHAALGSFAYFGHGHRAPARCRPTSRTCTAGPATRNVVRLHGHGLDEHGVHGRHDLP